MNYVIELEQILSSILGGGKRMGKGEFYTSCPFCHHHKPKLAINLYKRKWQCWVCKANGNSIVSLTNNIDVPAYLEKSLKECLENAGHFENYTPTSDVVNANIRLPTEFVPLWKRSTNHVHLHALSYLKSRGYNMSHIMRYGVGYAESGEYSNRIIIPSYDSNGSLRYFTGRDIFGHSSLKYKNPPVARRFVGFENCINYNEDIIFVEGPLDAMKVGLNASPLFGKKISDFVRDRLYSNRVKCVYIMLDPDARRDMTDEATKLYKNSIQVKWVGLKTKDPGDMSRHEILEIISSAKELSFSDLIYHKTASV